MDFRDRVLQWNEWLQSGNHKAFEHSILQLHLDMNNPVPGEMYICLYQQAPYTHVMLGIPTLGGTTGHGYSKCNPSDKWSSDIGARIAVVRAARNLFRKLQECVRC